MHWKQVVYGIIPSIENNKINKILKQKLSDIKTNESIQKEYCLLCHFCNEKCDINLETVKRIQESEISRKSILEDKAKTNIIGITIAITLIMGAYGLCNDLYSKFPEPFLKIILFTLFATAALYMILAGIISIKTIVDENRIFLCKNDGIGMTEEMIISDLDICIGQNRIQNLIRNNNIYTSYQYIKNALICLFIVLIISIFPVATNQSTGASLDIDKRQYFYSEDAAKFMLEKNLNDEVNDIVAKYINSSEKLQKDGVYGFINESSTLFLKIEIKGKTVNVLLIEPIDNVSER